jgi:hypothetical protein
MRGLFCCLWLVLCTVSFVQERTDFVTALEAVYNHQQGKVNYDALTDQLWDFYQQPIDLNHTSYEELKQLHILSDKQINSLLDHLQQNGALVSIYELQAIPALDLATIKLLIPFVRVAEVYPPLYQGISPISQQPRYGSWLSRYERTLETAKGYTPNPKTGEIPYQGSPDKLVTRLKWKHPHGWGFGITARKYPGEAFTWDPATTRYGFDRWSAYLSLENKGYLKKLILGNYQVGYGQGLVLNAGFSMDKSGEAIPIMRTAHVGVKPHQSFSTYGFMGIAATGVWKSLEQSIYYAYNSLDGKIYQTQKDGSSYVSNLQRSGSHRTTQELAKKGQVNEQVVGSTLVYKSKNQQAEVGINGVYTWYAVPIYKINKKLSYPFEGKDNWNLGLFYRYLWHSLHFFGEGAVSQSGGKAGLAGVIASISSYVDLSLLVRHYDANFHSFYGDAFRENSSGNHNEQGIYIGISIQPIKKWRVNAYYDYFYFQQPTAKVATPAAGYDWLVKTTYQFNKSQLLLLQYKEKQKVKNIPKSKATARPLSDTLTAPGTQRKYKTQYRQQLNKYFSLQSESQASTYSFLDKLTWGYGISQSLTYKLQKFDITGQVAWFDTDFDNRLYVHEKGPLYSQSMPTMYYKQGIKSYIAMGYKPTTNWRIEGKYSLTWIQNDDHLGSGQDQVMGNTKNELRLQVIYQF